MDKPRKVRTSRRKVVRLTQEKVDNWNKAPLSDRKLIFDLLNADAEVCLIVPRPKWVGEKIALDSDDEVGSDVQGGQGATPSSSAAA